MFLETWLTWIATHIGLGSVKNVTAVRKDLVDTKKANLEIHKLEDEAEKRDSLVIPATFEDVKNFDPKFKEINQKALTVTLDKQENKIVIYTNILTLVLTILIELIQVLGIIFLSILSLLHYRGSK